MNDAEKGLLVATAQLAVWIANDMLENSPLAETTLRVLLDNVDHQLVAVEAETTP